MFCFILLCLIVNLFTYLMKMLMHIFPLLKTMLVVYAITFCLNPAPSYMFRDMIDVLGTWSVLHIPLFWSCACSASNEQEHGTLQSHDWSHGTQPFPDDWTVGIWSNWINQIFLSLKIRFEKVTSVSVC